MAFKLNSLTKYVMKIIKNKTDYENANLQLKKLLLIVNNDTPKTDNNFIELDKISNLIARL